MTGPRPPAWARWIVRFGVGGEVRDLVEGDLEERFAAELARGVGPGEARRRYGRRALASVAAVWRGGWDERTRGGAMPGWDEVKRTVRTLGRRPGYTAAVTLTLGLALGAAAAVFSVVDGVLLRPLALPRPHELVTVWMTQDGEPTNLSGPNGLDLRDGVGAFEELVLYSRGSVLLEAGEGPVRQMPAVQVTDGVLATLGVAPAMGRDLSPGDLAEGAPPVALLSHGLWTATFGADPGVVGRSVTVDGRSTEIVGVVPEGVTVPLAPDARLWVPFRNEGAFRARDLIWLGGLARLAPGVDVGVARAEAESVWEALREAHPDVILDAGVTVLPLQAYLVDDVRSALWLLLAATGLLLAMACVSVGGLYLARGRARGAELALRASLGAARRRIVAELVGEGLLLTGAAAAVGAAVAAALVWGMRAFGPADLPRLDAVAVDGRVLGVGAAVALSVGLVTAGIPALRAAAAAPAARLVHGGRGAVGGRGEGRRRFTTVGVQVALATVLLAGAAVLGRSFLTLVQVDPGYRIDGIVTAELEISPEVYGEAETRRDLYRRIQDRVAAQPGVEEAGWALIRPLDDSRINYEVAVDGQPVGPPGEAPSADLQLASGGYYRALDIRLLQGRLFADSDIGGPPVALVTESLARDLWGEVPAVGRRIGWVVDRAAEPRWHEVVGVVADVRQQSLQAETHGTLILDFLQRPQGGATLTVRTTGDVAALTRLLRDEIPRMGPGIPEPEVSTLRAARSADVAPQRFLVLLLGLFSGVAVTLAAVGTYATLAYATARRRVEMGVRLAVGADPARLRSEVVRQGMVPVLAGLALGLVGALGAAGAVRGLLFEVPARDPLSLGLTAALLAAVGLAACLIPAARAARTDPVRSLREG